MVDILNIAIILLIILVSMTLHEAVHAFVSYFLGDNTAKNEGRLTFNPIRHIDPFMTIMLPLVMVFLGGPVFGGAKPVPFNPNKVKYGEWGAAAIAIAGPLTNFIIAFVAFGVGVVSGVIHTGGMIETTVFGNIIMSTITINLGFFVFNMLPIPPLDGSRILYALAPDSARRIMEQIEQYGIFLVFLLVLLPSNPIGQILSYCLKFFISVFMSIYHV